MLAASNNAGLHDQEGVYMLTCSQYCKDNVASSASLLRGCAQWPVLLVSVTSMPRLSANFTDKLSKIALAGLLVNVCIGYYFVFRERSQRVGSEDDVLRRIDELRADLKQKK
eukprot:jgi/Chrzof1/11214/Cz05g28090.t1